MPSSSSNGITTAMDSNDLPVPVVLVTQEAKRRSKRDATEIEQCQAGLAEQEAAASAIRSVKRQLTDSKRQNDWIANLASPENAFFSWSNLNMGNRWKKEHVWAVLCTCSSDDLPFALREARWETAVPEAIRSDRDLFLARMERKEFAEYYNINHGRYHFEQQLERPVHLPENLRSDKSIAMKLVQLCPQILLQDVLPPNVLADEDVFCALLRSDIIQEENHRLSQLHKDRGHLLSKFCAKSVRSKTTLMLEAAATALKQKVLEHLGESLQSSPYFATSIAVILDDKLPGNALEHFSALVQSRKTVAYAFCRKNGRNLEFVHEKLHTSELVRIACKQDASALPFCKNKRVKNNLSRDYEYMLDIFKRLSPLHGNPDLYRMLSMIQKRSVDLIVLAYQKRSLDMKDLPPGLSNDRKFWKSVIPKESRFWNELPDCFKRDTEFAKCITDFKDEELANQVLEACPSLRPDRSIWQMILESEGIFDEIFELLEKWATETILADKELMSTACSYCCRVLGLINSDAILKDEDFIRSALLEDDYWGVSVLPQFPHNVQLLYPHLVVEVIEQDCDDGFHCEYETEHIAEQLWANLAVAKAWFGAGGPMHDLLPNELKNSEEFGLFIAQNCTEESLVDGAHFLVG